MNQQENREDDIQTESLADLPVTDEQAEQAKGGSEEAKIPPGSTVTFTYLVRNTGSVPASNESVRS
jgi:hypothetical protein